VSIPPDPAGSGANEGNPAAVADTGGAAAATVQADAAGATAAAGTIAPPKEATSVDTVDLTLSFGKRAVLSDINIDFGAGKVTAILGPTGSGKSTLLRTINRMNDKVTGYGHQGDVLVEGRSIWNSGMQLMVLRQKVGMLFQRPNPFPMSIMDNVIAGVRAHHLAPRKELKKIAEQRLREVGLLDAVAGRLKDSPFRLSGGQQQLLCLARALAMDPDVLLLDEPTSSLDPVATESIEGLVRTLVPRITVIIVTHNLAQARRVSDDTVFLNKGRLVEHGETKQLFENPRNEETAHYVTGRFG
jgi:phosphate transport system ATP-binding protein